MSHKAMQLSRTYSGKICIDGNIVSSHSKQFQPVINPATMEEIGFISLCEQEDVQAATKAASQAQPIWAKLGNAKRGKLVQACGLILQDHAEELSELISLETGKSLRSESRAEMSVINEVFSFYGGLALELKGETIPYDPNILSFTIREPIGVVCAILPWNVPLMLMAMKVAPVLVAGNSVVLKPSPEASLCVLAAVALMNQILPKGVLNVITGAAQTGTSLVAHPDIKKVTFTGSVEAGRKVYQNAAAKLIPVSLELGGKSPLIIFPDANIDVAVDCAFEAMRFTRQGQSCSAASRIFLHESIHDDFVQKLLNKLDQMLISDPLDEKTDIGAIISKRQYDKIKGFLERAEQDKSLQIHYASKLPQEAHLQKGLFMRPALITGLINEHEICQQEIFGPVAAILKWNLLDEVIKDANNTEFGLAAGIWTNDLKAALQAVHQLDAGFVQVNQYMVFKPSLPFGGFKNSGLGKEASLKAMIDNFTKEKTILINSSYAK